MNRWKKLSVKEEGYEEEVKIKVRRIKRNGYSGKGKKKVRIM